MTDDRMLRDAYAELIAVRAPASCEGCPPPEALLALVEREADEDTRLATLDHAMGCAHCRGELDLLRAATDASTQVGGGASTFGLADGSHRRARRWPVRPLAIAAGIVVVIGVGVISRNSGDGPSQLRGGEAPLPLPLLGPERSSDGGVLLRWRSVADAPRYRVEVYGSSGATVAEGVVSDTTFTVSATMLSGRPDTLSWMVTALRSDGGEVRSQLGRITP
jgi:hypothetical protein